MTDVLHEKTLEFVDSTDEIISFSDAFVGTDKHILNVKVQCGVITTSLKNIFELNKYLYINIDSVEYEIVLTEGSYSASTLATEMATRINATIPGTFGTWTVVYNTTTNRYTFDFDDSASYTWQLYVKLNLGPEDIIGLFGTVEVGGQDYTGMEGINTSITTTIHPDVSGGELVYIMLHENGSTDYTRLDHVGVNDRINVFGNGPTVKVCVNPSSTYKISILRQKKNGHYLPFRVGPTNTIKIAFFN